MPDYSLFPILQKFVRLTWRADDPNLGECKCPGHQDSTNSLHVTIKIGDNGKPKILLNCLAGCQTANILYAMNEDFPSLFPDRTMAARDFPSSAGKVKPPRADKPTAPAAQPDSPPAEKKRFVRAYDYHDADGKLIHQTVRWEPKFFTQRRRAEPNKTYKIGGKEYKSHKDPLGNWWINTLKGIEPVIYRLPRILKAPKEKIVFLCEGEKDVESLEKSFNLYATTVPMGSGKWRKSYRDHFFGRRVIIIPDTDKPRQGQTDPAANAGYDGARKIAAELVEVCNEVRICYLPNLFGFEPKWDLSDWIHAGGTKAQFFEACNAAEVLGIGHPGLIPAGITAEQLKNTPPVSETETNKSVLLPAPIAKGNPKTNGTPIRLDRFNRPLRGQIRNVIELPGGGHDALPVREIMHNFFDVTNGWPKRVGKSLFFVDREESVDPNFYPIQWLDSSSSLFAWAGDYSGENVVFGNSSGFTPKEEIYKRMKHEADLFDSVEQYPHEPRVPSVYYACKDQPEWKSTNPGCLMGLIALLEPAEPVDFDLILALLATLVWGGPGGARPLFVITADSGRGAGKTTFATLAASLVGGSLQISAQADQEIICQRLLSPEGLERRVVILDNVKSLKFSNADLEAFVTSEKISGKQMYVGEASRANRITYMMTMNGPSLSSDLAKRAVVIKLGIPKHTGNWLQVITDYIAINRISIIAELLEILRQPQIHLESHTRWGMWEKEVLCRLSSAQICQEAIISRQTAIDSDQDECNLITEHIERQLIKNNMQTTIDRIFISVPTAANWVNEALGERHAKNAASKILAQKITEGKIPRFAIADGPQRIDGTSRKERGYFWIPEDWDSVSGDTVRPSSMMTFNVDDFVF